MMSHLSITGQAKATPIGRMLKVTYREESVDYDRLEIAHACTQQNKIQLECGPMPNVVAAQPNIGGALCESSVIPFLVPRRKVWLTSAAGVPCSNDANIGERKTWT